ncbi:RNA-binding domain-containing protein [Lophiostoma macrostomum CBS 122681]|uniref:RNA-binding domain-containing protein n=1 Tax=Lophiostoma macrostomum CBS 122681 TaxID=1314788 RepID=A0A6A6TPG1_9PLEO|nr:RNA-binding domain-containing protein [Lophiostoma macrostomum CBS 122681]
MGPRVKRQRLSQDGAEAVTATADPEQPPAVSAPTSEPSANGSSLRHKQLSQRRSLFVRSLPPQTTTEDLTEHFSESYPIKHALTVLDKTTKQCKGYGFVTFADAEDAQRALDELNGSELHGKKIRIEIAEPRHRDVDGAVPGQKSTPGPAAAKAKAEREEQKKGQGSPKLIVRNLPWTVKTPEQLGLLFRMYGKIKDVTLPKTQTGQLKGFGFVLLRGRKNAEKALAGVNGKEVDGRQLAVDWAVDKDTWENLQSNAPENDEDAEMKDAVESDSDASEESSVVSSSSEDEDSDSDEDEDAEEDEDSNTDYEDVSDSDIDTAADPTKPDLSDNTLFIRNLPFSATDDTLHEHFEHFGKLRYARVVLDPDTERPKGTGFVCFVDPSDALTCLKNMPRITLSKKTKDGKDGSTITVTHSVLENADADPTGAYTLDGRILQLSRAVSRNEAVRLTAEGAASRFSRDKDKRRLYLLSEGTIPHDSPLYQKLSPSEVTMRDTSAKQRQMLIQSNPSLHLSLTRLSIRNIPRSITSKDLKALARRAVVGFAQDVKADTRRKLSKEEVLRGGAEMAAADKMRKKKGKGVVKQAKIVYETNEGKKVEGDDVGGGAGRSRGYGFIEYYTHRNALMGLRWLNGHAVEYKVQGSEGKTKGKKAQREAIEDRKKRLIVEFAIENANVVHRRSDREDKAKTKEKTSDSAANPKPHAALPSAKGKAGGRDRPDQNSLPRGKKRKHDDDGDAVVAKKGKVSRRERVKAVGSKGQGTGAQGGSGDGAAMVEGDTKGDKVAQRSRIIRKKRMARRARKAGGV